MIKKLQRRFIAAAGLAVLVVLLIVVGTINFTMRYILSGQTEYNLNMILAIENTEKHGRARAMTDIAIRSQYFRAILDENRNVTALDLDSDSPIDKDDAYRLIADALASGSEDGRLIADQRVFAYKISGRRIAFLDCTPAVNTIYTLHQTSFAIVLVSGIGFVLLFALFSRRAIDPIVKNMESQKRFITNASHELKTPLTIISANAELLEAMNGQSDWTKNITSQVGRMTELINELIALSKVSEFDRPPLSDVDFSGVVTKSTDSILPVMQKQNKDFERQITDNIHVMADEKMLTMLVNILVENASKYCDENGKTDVSLSSNKNRAVLSVTNDYADGENVDHARFFERFYQEEQSHNSRKSGFGIGLSIAREITEMFKGKIQVKYADKRITFEIFLPESKKK